MPKKLLLHLLCLCFLVFEVRKVLCTRQVTHPSHGTRYMCLCAQLAPHPQRYALSKLEAQA